MQSGNSVIHYGSAAMKNAVLLRSEKLIVVTVFTKFGSPSDLQKKKHRTVVCMDMWIANEHVMTLLARF